MPRNGGKPELHELCVACQSKTLPKLSSSKGDNACYHPVLYTCGKVKGGYLFGSMVGCGGGNFWKCVDLSTIIGKVTFKHFLRSANGVAHELARQCYVSIFFLVIESMNALALFSTNL